MNNIRETVGLQKRTIEHKMQCAGAVTRSSSMALTKKTHKPNRDRNDKLSQHSITYRRYARDMQQGKKYSTICASISFGNFAT